jgi:gliding motility-associated-like protein
MVKDLYFVIKFLIFFISYLKVATCYADHIAGGNLELKAVKNSPGSYLIRIVLLRDNAGQTEPDPSEAVTIFRKRDNHMMRYEFNINFSSQSQRSIPFTNRTCATQRKLELSEYVYEKEITLDPYTYDDPQGYYMVWNGCCRNNGLNNIALPGKSIMTFYMEFPAVRRDGNPLINSSPSFDLINGEYACVNQPFKFEFDAKDSDNDELRYSISSPVMGVPLSPTNTQLSIPYPAVGMSEYPSVQWLSGYDPTNAIPGLKQPSLSVDKYGVISVTPNKEGLFLFSVTVEEFRNGQRIGMVRRDYQILVIDCPLQEPPQASLIIEGYPGKDEVTVCKGKNLILQVENNANWYYQWQRDGLNIKGANQANYTVSEPGTYDVEVSFKSQCGRTRSTKSVRINTFGQNSKLSPSGSTTICNGGSVQLTADGDPSLDYKWFRNGNSFSSKSKQINASEPGAYYAIITDSTQQCTIQSDTIEISSTLQRQRVAFQNKVNLTLCPNGSVSYKLDPIADASYQWFKDKQIINDATSSTLTVRTTGIYYAVVKNLTSGCMSYSDSVKLNSKVMPSVLLSSDRLAICSGDSARLTVSPTDGIAFEVFQDGSKMNDLRNGYIDVYKSGNYIVKGKDIDNCDVTSNPISISIVERIAVTLDSIKNICGTSNSAIQLKGKPLGGVYDGPGVNGDKFDPNKAGIGHHKISYIIKSQFECQNGAAYQVANVSSVPNLELGPSKEVWKGASITLNGYIGDQYAYEWFPSDYLSSTNKPDVITLPDKDITYVLSVKDKFGCLASDSITIKVYQRISVPDAFTPDGDGVNDYWELKGIEEYPELELTIYNRWGKPIYFSKGYKNPFDGTSDGQRLSSGAYPYILKYKSNSQIIGTVHIVL